MLFRDRLEIWNPGRLPDGFTIQKLHEVHRSEPTNPVLAHPLFMAGYIEHLRTGTTDMIADCEAFGLRTPEFIQADDFRTIIYRQEKVSDPAQKVSNPTEKVTEQGQKVSDPTPKVSNLDSKSVKPRPTAKQQKVLDFCDETPRTAQEIWIWWESSITPKHWINISISWSMLISYVLREPRFMTPTAVTSPRTRPPTDERPMGERQATDEREKQ